MKPEDYVHRIGRTGRAGRSGIAITLAVPADRFKVRAIERFTTQQIPASIIEGLEPRFKPEQRSNGRGFGGRPDRGGDRPRSFGDRPRSFGDRSQNDRSRFNDGSQSPRRSDDTRGFSENRPRFNDETRAYADRPRSNEERKPGGRPGGFSPDRSAFAGERHIEARPRTDAPFRGGQREEQRSPREQGNEAPRRNFTDRSSSSRPSSAPRTFSRPR